MVRNFLTFDIEEWYCVNYEGIDFEECRELPSNLESTVDGLIDLCGRYNIQTTCFVMGQLAEEKPHIVRKLYDAGHEIASHGYGHRLVSGMSSEEFREDLVKSRDILEDIIGERIVGYRAPSYSVNEGNLNWFYSILEESGFRYSSSVFPVKTFLYGIDGFPQQMHCPFIDGRKGSLLEIPVPVVNIMGRKIGLYVRLFPAWFIFNFVKKQNRKGNSVFLYLHPREVDLKQPRLTLPFFTSLIHYWGIRGCEKKIEKLLQSCGASFCRMRDIISDAALTRGLQDR